MLKKLWNDDAGIIVVEYLVLGTFLAIALIVGVSALAGAINTELVELGESIESFNQGYSASGFSACGASSAGSAANDTCGGITTGRVTPTVCTIAADFCQ